MHEPVRRPVTIAPTLVNVQSRGSIRLRSADPTWHPEIDPAYFDDPADLDAMLGGYRRMLDMVWQGPMTRLLDEPWEPGVRNPTDDQIIDVDRPAGPDALSPDVDVCDGYGRGQRRRSAS